MTRGPLTSGWGLIVTQREGPRDARVVRAPRMTWESATDRTGRGGPVRSRDARLGRVGGHSTSEMTLKIGM